MSGSFNKATFDATKKICDDDLKEKKYDAVIELYTKLLSDHPLAPNEEKRNVYSNRSYAKFLTGKYTESLSDADKCIEIDPEWSRGFSRKGDALEGLGDFSSACAAFQTAMDKSSNKTDHIYLLLKSKMEKMKVDGRPTLRALYYLRIAIFVSAILYMIPFTGAFSGYMYKLFVFAAMGSCLTEIVNTHGMIQFNMEFVKKISSEAATQRLFLCFVLFAARLSTLMFMMPVIVTEVANLLPVIVNYAKKPQNEKYIKDNLAPLIAKYPQQVSQAQIDKLFVMLKDNNRVRFFQTEISEKASELEVWCGIFLIVSLLLPTRDFMTLFMWWNYLKLRYMSDDGSRGIKKAFTNVDITINEQLLSRSWIPAFVRNVYEKIKGFLATQAAPPSASSGAGSGFLSNLTSKCSVM